SRLDFFGLSFGMESVAQIIVLCVADLLKGVSADMMVGNDQPVCGNKGAAPSGIEANARFLEVFEPLRRGFELIFLLELFQRRIVEQPHSLITKKRRSDDEQSENRSDKARNHRAT